jgi:hypothetical protein
VFSKVGGERTGRLVGDLHILVGECPSRMTRMRSICTRTLFLLAIVAVGVIGSTPVLAQESDKQDETLLGSA